MHVRSRAAMLGAMLVMAGLGGCGVLTTGPSGPSRADGVVHFLALEGGFYAIHTDDGHQYDPVNLPAAFRQEGMPVRFSGRVLTDMMSIHMYGDLLEITEIEAR